MEEIYLFAITDLLGAILIFCILFLIGKRIVKIIKNHENKITNNRLLNPEEYLPKEEVDTLKQVLYLIILFLLFIFLIYTLIPDKTSRIFAIIELVFMVNIAISLDYSSWKNKLLFLLLIPYSSISFIVIGINSISILHIVDFLHTPAILYLMVIYFRKFKEYTETNGLGMTIILLFSIIFISFIFTMIVEMKNPIDAINMVSNAFTSNGYAVLGESTLGKMNSLFLVWSGYILSGVGTATLTVAILSRNFNKKIADIENKYEKTHVELEMIKENNEEIKELIKENKEEIKDLIKEKS